MTIVQTASTVEVLQAHANLSGSALHPSDAPSARFDPLGWLVNLTEAAQLRLTRAALAQGLVTADSADSSRFSNDAAGGGSRAIEAALCMRGRAELR
jgi:hypothetical protein